MPESGLSLQLSDLAEEVAHYLGFGRLTTNWGGWQATLPYQVAAANVDSQLRQIMTCVQAGYRQVIYPQAPPYHWSFMTTERTLTTVATQTNYALPDDYGGFDGGMTFASTAASLYTVERVGIGKVRQMTQISNGLTTKPSMFAEYPLASDGVTGQRFGVAFFPIPDAAYVLTYRSNLNPQPLSNANPYPLGGLALSEVILESCLAVAESRINDKEDLHAKRFQVLLQAAMANDARFHRPEMMGYNEDRSDGPALANQGQAGAPLRGSSAVTYNGNSMGS